MSVAIKEIINVMEQIAPPNLAADWDNVGLLLGSSLLKIDNVLVALDATDDVVSEAIQKNAGLIITHHPVLFQPIGKINDTTILGRRLLRLLENKIAVYSAHSNLDAAENGTNETICKMLGLTDVSPIIYDGIGAMGRTGILSKSITAGTLLSVIRDKLKVKNAQFCGDMDRKVRKLAVCAGSGSKTAYFAEAVKNGCDCFLTGDTRFHEMQDALNIGLCIIDATHYATELPVIEALAKLLNNAFSDREIRFITTETNGQVYNE